MSKSNQDADNWKIAGVLAGGAATLVGMLVLGVRSLNEAHQENGTNLAAMQRDAGVIAAAIPGAEARNKPASDAAFRKFCSAYSQLGNGRECDDAEKGRPVDVFGKIVAVNHALKTAEAEQGNMTLDNINYLAKAGAKAMAGTQNDAGYRQQLQDILTNGGTYKVAVDAAHRL